MQLKIRIQPVQLEMPEAESDPFAAVLSAAGNDPLLSAWHGPAVGQASQPILRGRGAAVAVILGTTTVKTLVSPSFSALETTLAEVATAADTQAAFPAPQFSLASSQWEMLVANTLVAADSLSLAEFQAASGLSAPIAFFSFGFSPTAGAVLIVPQITTVVTDQGAWELVVMKVADQELPTLPPKQITSTKEAGGAEQTKQPAFTLQDDSATAWQAAVTHLVSTLQAGQVHKTVLARAVQVHSEAPMQLDWILQKLAVAYPTTWKFAVAGLVGATPEMLADVRSGQVFSRVLAGTCAPGDETYLESSAKDHAEHKFAADSVKTALRPWCTELVVSPQPFILKLPNVSHLATDVAGPLNTTSAHPLFEILGSLHPSAAVCGTPTPEAFALIRQLEPSDRGRYAAPVGWVDGAGNGAGGLALRCGQVDSSQTQITLMAGCGIMPNSDPAAEVAETRAKLRPLLEVFGL